MKYALIDDTGAALTTISGPPGFDPHQSYPFPVPEGCRFEECPDWVDIGDRLADAGWVSGKTPSRVVSRAEFIVWAAWAGALGHIIDIAQQPAHPLRSSAIALKLLVDGTLTSIDFSLPGIDEMLTVWVSSGIITQEQADELLRLAK